MVSLSCVEVNSLSAAHSEPLSPEHPPALVSAGIHNRAATLELVKCLRAAPGHLEE